MIRSDLVINNSEKRSSLQSPSNNDGGDGTDTDTEDNAGNTNTPRYGNFDVMLDHLWPLPQLTCGATRCRVQVAATALGSAEPGSRQADIS